MEVKVSATRKGKKYELNIDVWEASTLDGMDRVDARMNAAPPQEGENENRVFLRRVIYPELLVVSSGELLINGEPVTWPPSFDVFCQLPQVLEQAWEKAVYSLNDQWLPKPADEDQKKEPSAA